MIVTRAEESLYGPGPFPSETSLTRVSCRFGKTVLSGPSFCAGNFRGNVSERGRTSAGIALAREAVVEAAGITASLVQINCARGEMERLGANVSDTGRSQQHSQRGQNKGRSRRCGEGEDVLVSLQRTAVGEMRQIAGIGEQTITVCLYQPCVVLAEAL